MGKMVYFLADNGRKIEWRLHKTKQGAMGIGSYHDSANAPDDSRFGLTSKDIQSMIHSHTDKKKHQKNQNELVSV
jgi:hypothetical protein